MINVYFLEDYHEHKKGTKEIIEYKKGDQSFIDRDKAIVLITDGIVEAFTTHIDRVGIEPEPEVEKKDDLKKEKPKRKKTVKQTAVSKKAEKREQAVTA